MKKQIILPDNWSEVTVKQFQSLNSIDENDTYRTEMIIKILSGGDLDVISSMDTNSRRRVVDSLSWTNVFPDEKYYKTEIAINNIVYTICDFNDLSTGQWIDLENYFKEPIDNLHKIISIFYGCKNSDLFLDVNIGDVYQSVVFFSNIAINLITTLPEYLESQMEQILKSLEVSHQRIDK